MSKQANSKDLDDFLLSRSQAGFFIYGQGQRRACKCSGVPDLSGYLLAKPERAPLTLRRVLGMIAWGVVVFQYAQMCLILFYALSSWFILGFDPSAPLFGLLEYGRVTLGDFGIILILEFPITLLAFVWLVNSDE